ncbi:unnamed protein product [Prunus armeniaca]|uniref:Uncharacterized protein n=1 Tax=Prunus armeniaca TaxID=36596 RepID=A0A6J5WH21_PRUAR|nr:unnamed protein product [Prunus armeniaca]
MTPTYQSHWEGFMMGMVEYNSETNTESGKLQLIVLLFILFEAGMEWAAGRKLKDSFIFLEASPSSHNQVPPMVQYFNTKF